MLPGPVGGRRLAGSIDADPIQFGNQRGGGGGGPFDNNATAQNSLPHVVAAAKAGIPDAILERGKLSRRKPECEAAAPLVVGHFSRPCHALLRGSVLARHAGRGDLRGVQTPLAKIVFVQQKHILLLLAHLW